MEEFEASLVELDRIMRALTQENATLKERCQALEELVREAHALLEGADTIKQQARYDAWRRQVHAL